MDEKWEGDNLKGKDMVQGLTFLFTGYEILGRLHSVTFPGLKEIIYAG